jgi:hypothetical protein
MERIAQPRFAPFTFRQLVLPGPCGFQTTPLRLSRSRMAVVPAVSVHVTCWLPRILTSKAWPRSCSISSPRKKRRTGPMSSIFHFWPGGSSTPSIGSGQEPLTRRFPVGLFGASTGAAAALVAAAQLGDRVRAVVSRGGRPDLAGAVLDRIHTPTLLIVGGLDFDVIELNQRAFAKLPGPKALEMSLARATFSPSLVRWKR